MRSWLTPAYHVLCTLEHFEIRKMDFFWTWQKATAPSGPEELADTIMQLQGLKQFKNSYWKLNKCTIHPKIVGSASLTLFNQCTEPQRFTGRNSVPRISIGLDINTPTTASHKFAIRLYWFCSVPQFLHVQHRNNPYVTTHQNYCLF